MELKTVREKIAELARILFGLGIAVVGKSEEDTGNDTLRLWAALTDLDKYVREVEANWSRIFLYVDTSTAITKEMEKVLENVGEAQNIRSCAHFEESHGLEAVCEICGLRVQSISLRLQQRIVRLQSILRAKPSLAGILNSFHEESLRDDVGAMADLSDELEKISDRIYELKQAKSPVQPDQSEIEGGQLVEYDLSSPAEPDACERCYTLNDIVSKYEESQLRLIEVTDELKLFKVENVERLKTQNVNQAAKGYEELCILELSTMEMCRAKGDESAASQSEAKYLTYRYEWAELLHSLERYEEGLLVAEETWRKRAEIHNDGAETKKSHQQYCLFLRSRKMFADAEKEYRKICSSKLDSDPEWAIASGFQLGLLLIDFGIENGIDKKPEAGALHWEMYVEARKRSTISPCLMIDIAEQVVQREEELEADNRPNPNRLLNVLREVWDTRGTAITPELPAVSHKKLLALGDKFGCRLYKSNDYAEASTILKEVWTSRRSQLGENELETLSSAEFYFKSCFDGEKYRDAVTVGEWIHERRDKISKYDRESTNALHSLGVAFMRSNKWNDAEIAFRELWRRLKRHLRVDHSDTLEAGREYGDVLARRGKNLAAKDVLGQVWAMRKVEPGDGYTVTLETGWKYGQTLEKLEETSEAEEVFKSVWGSAKVRLASGVTENERHTFFYYGTRLASMLENRGSLLEGQASHKPYATAVGIYREMLEMRVEEPRSAETLHYECRSGICQYERGHYDSAVKGLKILWDRPELLEYSEDWMEAGKYLFLAMLKTMVKKKGKFDSEESENARKIINKVITKAKGAYGSESERANDYRKVRDELPRRK